MRTLGCVGGANVGGRDALGSEREKKKKKKRRRTGRREGEKGGKRRREKIQSSLLLFVSRPRSVSLLYL